MLILFPEALHPAIVNNNGLTKGNFGAFFATKGSCCLKYSKKDAVVTGGDLDEEVSFWENAWNEDLLEGVSGIDSGE